jgi:hypothetical protein
MPARTAGKKSCHLARRSHMLVGLSDRTNTDEDRTDKSPHRTDKSQRRTDERH